MSEGSGGQERLPTPEERRQNRAKAKGITADSAAARESWWGRRSTLEKVGMILGPLIFVVVIASIASNGGNNTGSATPAAGSSGGTDATEVEFTVNGSAPAGVDITYGSDSSNYQGPKQPPMDKTLSIDDNALYYAVNAQLMGGGNITCEIRIGDEVRTGHAVGGYNICSVQLNKDFNGGWG